MTWPEDQDRDSAQCDIVELIHERNEQIRRAFANVMGAEGSVKAAFFEELVFIVGGREAVARELIGPPAVQPGPVASAVHTGPVERTEVISDLLSSMDVKDDSFDVELIAVARKVTLQIAAKERDDFPLLRRSLPAAELHALAEVLLSAERIIRARATAI